MPNALLRSIISPLFFSLFFAFSCFAQTPLPSPPPNAAERFADRLLAAETDAARDRLLAENANLLTAELAAVLLGKGRTLMSKNEFPSAERSFNLSLKASEAAKHRAGIAAALRNLGGASGVQGKFDRALEYFQKAVAVYETLADENGLAQALRGVGNVESTFGNYEKGIEAFRRSLRLFEKIGDRAGQAGINSSLNSVYQSVGDYELALEHGTRALALARESGNKSALGQALSNLANLMNSLGDYRAALQYNKEALRIFERENVAERVALTLNNIGNTYLQQNDASVAETYFRRGLELREKIGDLDGIARSNFRLGELMIWQANYAAALQFLKRAVELRESEAKDPAHLAAALARLGDVYFRQKDLPKAGDFYRRALSIADSIGEKETTATILTAAARFHLASGDREAATAKINRAIEIAGALNSRETLWQARTLAGEIQSAAGDTKSARRSFAAAIETIEDARFLVAGGEREQQQFFESKIAPYHHSIEINVRENKYAEALAFAERAKARVLLDVLRTGRGQSNETLSAAENALETKLRGAIYSLDAQLRTESSRLAPDAGKINNLREQNIEARADYDAFAAAHPELKTRRGETRIASLDELNALLPTNESALAEYVVTEKQTFLFAATRGKNNAPDLRVYALDLTKQELNRHVSDFRRALARRDIRFADKAGKLYRKILAPAAAQISGKARLTIVPDDALWELPFQALIAADGAYVVENHAVSYAPSLSVLVALQRQRRGKETNATGDLLAFGNPSQPKKRGGETAETVSPIKENADSVLMSDFADLPEAEKQVKALSALYAPKRSRVLTGEFAAEGAFKREAANYRVIHFATHGVLDDASPLYSYVLLSRGAEAKDSNEDGLLQAWELMRMNLNADFVVLSACETARGAARSGEGIIGLSWALFVAGSPATVASQWKVESAATTELMLGFYRRLQRSAAPKKTSKAEALRRAALALLKREKYAHPF